jgi:uncharacterized protein
MELLGYIGAAFIGISLGLIGAGGSILTVPLMVYLFRVPVLLASSYSLAIVGVTSLLGAVWKYRQGEVRIKHALLFGLISITLVSSIRAWVIPIIPNELFSIHDLPVTFSALSMVCFSMLMIAAARVMMQPKRSIDRTAAGSDLPRLFVSAIIVGILTGLLGAGGGFLLIPALVLGLGLPMKHAVGTSLLIIALNSLSGFAMDLSHLNLDWQLLFSLTFIAAAGMIAGVAMAKQIEAQKLRIGFAFFIMIMGVGILFNETLIFFF